MWYQNNKVLFEIQTVHHAHTLAHSRTHLSASFKSLPHRNTFNTSKISCAVLVPEEFVIRLRIPSKHLKSGHYRPASITPSELRFAGGPIVARDWIRAGHIICRGRPLNSFAVSRAANSIDPDQTEPTLFAKKYF